jgi:dTDP-4-dehydrorhamnose reductase
MKKVLVLGATGMLGSACYRVLSEGSNLSTEGTSRTSDKLLRQMDAGDLNQVRKLFSEIEPDYVVNCIGIIKPHISESDSASIRRAISINSEFPIFLADLASTANFKVIQIATDCVYSGKKGNYTEIDQHDATDVYGKTKSLGEVPSENFLHLRASIIGPELGRSTSLLEWFRSQPKGSQLNGFEDHIWNGVTTYQFAKLARGIIENESELSGTRHIVPANRVSKYELLNIFSNVYDRGDIQISKITSSNFIDRTLETENEDLNLEIWNMGGYTSLPTIDEMVREQAFNQA